MQSAIDISSNHLHNTSCHQDIGMLRHFVQTLAQCVISSSHWHRASFRPILEESVILSGNLHRASFRPTLAQCVILSGNLHRALFRPILAQCVILSGNCIVRHFVQPLAQWRGVRSLMGKNSDIPSPFFNSSSPIS